MGVQLGPTSILPPTRARRGGRGLSLSLLSCLLDCRRPPGGSPTTASQRGPGHPDPTPPTNSPRTVSPLRETSTAALPPVLTARGYPNWPPHPPRVASADTHSALPVFPQSPRLHPRSQWNIPTGCPRARPATLGGPAEGRRVSCASGSPSRGPHTLGHAEALQTRPVTATTKAATTHFSPRAPLVTPATRHSSLTLQTTASVFLRRGH